jgi:membrane protein YqaA with SNARE-associated domain
MIAFLRRLSELTGLKGDIPTVVGLVWLLIAIGLLSLLIPAYAQKITSGWAAALIVLGAGLFLAGAATVTGSLVGFMFGVPRYRRADREAQAADQGTTAPNTNLEQISDWLTKIIVGVGLTQIPQINLSSRISGINGEVLSVHHRPAS